ncbi:hypothetical protein C8Q80DRAFT_1126061 [Daedaleopsis nitida]|nr:hypothetical protein C8Q80DRAFT_1126061 [Daedaleopsis nitida]
MTRASHPQSTRLFRSPLRLVITEVKPRPVKTGKSILASFQQHGAKLVPMGHIPNVSTRTGRPVQHTYSNSYSQLRGELRVMFDTMLREASGDPNATMCWTVKVFYTCIFDRYGLALRGWPPSFTFQNLSAASVEELRELDRRCRANPPELFFAPPTREEFGAALIDYGAAAPGPLFPAALPTFEHSNIGRRTVATRGDGLPIVNKDGARMAWHRTGYRDLLGGESYIGGHCGVC